MKKLRLFKKSSASRKAPSSPRVKYWWLAVLAVAVLVGFPYLAVQQSYRQNANDPQIQYAQDLATALEQGASPEAFGGNSPVDPRKSLGLFLIVTDDQKKILANTMQVEGDPPVPPNGTFDAAKNKGQQRFTWQPKKDIRVAAVLQYYKGSKPGYLLVGRSISEVEKREQQLTYMALGALGVLVALVTIAVRIGIPSRTKLAHAQSAAAEPLAFDDTPAVLAPTAEEEKVEEKVGTSGKKPSKTAKAPFKKNKTAKKITKKA